jgi:hypothetical protein
VEFLWIVDHFQSKFGNELVKWPPWVFDLVSFHKIWEFPTVAFQKFNQNIKKNGSFKAGLIRGSKKKVEIYPELESEIIQFRKESLEAWDIQEIIAKADSKKIPSIDSIRKILRKCGLPEKSHETDEEETGYKLRVPELKRKPRIGRSSFNAEQINELEKVFQATQYPDIYVRED